MRLHPDEYADLRRTQPQYRPEIGDAGRGWRAALVAALLIGLISASLYYADQMLSDDTAPIGCEQHRAELVACVEGL